MERNKSLAAIVRTAIYRITFCQDHDQRRDSAGACHLCIVEAVAGIRGRTVRFGSIRQIMTACPGGSF